MELRLYRFPEWLETEYKCILLKRSSYIPPEERAEPTPHEGRLDESLSRSRRIIKETILCNQFDLFCTFTFDKMKVKDRTDYRELKKQLAKAFDNYKQRYDKDFKYLLVPELHEDGAVHFHGTVTFPKGAPDNKGMCCPRFIQYRDIHGNLQTGPNKKGYMNWPYYSDRFGYFSCSWIRDYTACAVYVSKYMTKDLASWFSKGDQIVMKSKGLIKPELVYIDYDQPIPGPKHPEDFKHPAGYCEIGMRNAYEVADIYFNPDDRWHRYKDQLDDMPDPPKGTYRPITTQPENLWPGAWQSLPGTVDDFEAVIQLAIEGYIA